MELLNYPKSDYLLNASLESLHAQSMDWLQELSFWSDEMAFFYHIIHNKKFSGSFPASQTASIEKELIRLNGEELDKVKAGVTSHERLLASVYKSASLVEEEVYREAHRMLLSDMQALYLNISNFKKRLFSFVEH